MSLKRIGIIKPLEDTDTFLARVNTQYFSSVIVTNLNPTETANLTVYIKPDDETDPDKYAYIAYNFPLGRQNSFETYRFAMNPLDEIWVKSTIDEVSFVAIGIPQSLISVRYTYGPTAERPTEPIPGDQFYDSTQNILQLYKPSGWKTVTTS
jgi:hypothetical protein